MKAGLYIRVSTEKQAKEGESLGEQEKTLTNYCNFRNIQIINLYREEGRSAKNTNRPQFQRMIRDCRLGNIDTVIVKKVDRLSRSLMDFEKTMTFFEEQNINLISLNENFDTSTAIGRAVIRIILTFAQLEREQTSERTADVLQYKAEQGMWPGGRSPLGYNAEKKIGLILNEEEGKTVEATFMKYLELASYKKVAQYLNQEGYTPKHYELDKSKTDTFQNTTVSRILKNPVYIGKIMRNDKLYPGKHKAIITEDIYNRVQTIIDQNYRKKSSIKVIGAHNFILEKLLKCSYCNGYMAPRWTRNHGKRYFYYDCTSANHGGNPACQTKAIPAQSMEALVLRRIVAIKRDKDLLQSILDNNHGSFEKEIDQLESEKAILNVRLTESANRAQAIVDKLLSVSELSHTQILSDEIKRLDEERHSLSQRIQDIGDRIQQLRNRSYNTGNIRDMFVHFTSVYSKLNKTDKRLLMKILIKDVIYKEDYLIINYYTNLDISKALISPAAWQLAGSLRPTLSAPVGCPTETFADCFRIRISVVQNGKKLFQIVKE